MNFEQECDIIIFAVQTETGGFIEMVGRGVVDADCKTWKFYFILLDFIF